MGMLKRFFENTRKPQGVFGKLMLSMMNAGHDKMASWGLGHMQTAPNATILDIGCGGGRNIANMLKKAPGGKFFGVDYSPESVKKSVKTNRAAVAQGKAEVIQASVSSLPFDAEKFDVITAFETVYFWPDLLGDFTEIKRVLKPGGIFLICNEASRREDSEKWTKMLDMRVYTKEELSNILELTGFCNISCHSHENGKWLCVTAQKPFVVL